MNGQQLREIRERHEWTQQDLADALNAALDRKYNPDTFRRWEKGDRNIPKQAADFIEHLAAQTALAGGFLDPDPPLDTHDLGERGQIVDDDTAPQGPPGANVRPQAALVEGSSIYDRACSELWELIATGVGMVGAATNSQALMADGAIIAADKDALGKAWGRLAETNDTFRKMLVGMTEGGAWLQVALVTGTTVSKCWQNHALLAEHQRAQAAANGYAAVHDAADPG